MQRFLTYFILPCFFLILVSPAIAQEEISETKILFRKEYSVYGMIHTGGWGLGYRNGKHVTGYKKRMWEGEILGMKHPKEYRIISFYENSKSFFYGKLNSFYILRGGYGRQHILNSKPYWGGVEVRMFYYGGISVGLTKPVYLYIVKFNEDTGEASIVTEKFDPVRHYIGDIYGRGPFTKGFDELGLHPGLYLKTGFNFEYGADDEFLKSLECGIAVDGYYKDIPIMAFNENQKLFTSFYVSIHFGRRKN